MADVRTVRPVHPWQNNEGTPRDDDCIYRGHAILHIEQLERELKLAREHLRDEQEIGDALIDKFFPV